MFFVLFAVIGEFKTFFLELLGFKKEDEDEQENQTKVPSKNENVNTNDVIDHKNRHIKQE